MPPLLVHNWAFRRRVKHFLRTKSYRHSQNHVVANNFAEYACVYFVVSREMEWNKHACAIFADTPRFFYIIQNANLRQL